MLQVNSKAGIGLITWNCHHRINKDLFLNLQYLFLGKLQNLIHFISFRLQFVNLFFNCLLHLNVFLLSHWYALHAWIRLNLLLLTIGPCYLLILFLQLAILVFGTIPYEHESFIVTDHNLLYLFFLLWYLRFSKQKRCGSPLL